MVGIAKEFVTITFIADIDSTVDNDTMLLMFHILAKHHTLVTLDTQQIPD